MHEYVVSVADGVVFNGPLASVFASKAPQVREVLSALSPSAVLERVGHLISLGLASVVEKIRAGSGDVIRLVFELLGGEASLSGLSLEAVGHGLLVRASSVGDVVSGVIAWVQALAKKSVASGKDVLSGLVGNWRSLLAEIPALARKEMSGGANTLGSRVLEHYTSAASELVNRILGGSQETIRTLNAVLGKGTKVVEDGKRMLSSADEALNKGFAVIVDDVVAEVKAKTASRSLGMEESELRDTCATATSKSMKKKVKNVFGVSDVQLAVGLVFAILLLALILAFIFLGVSAFRGGGAATALINSGMVVVGGVVTSAGNSKSGSSVFDAVIPKIRKFLSSFVGKAIMGGVVSEVAGEVVVGLVRDDALI